MKTPMFQNKLVTQLLRPNLLRSVQLPVPFSHTFFVDLGDTHTPLLVTVCKLFTLEHYGLGY